MNQSWIYMCSPSRSPPPHLPLHPIPLGLPSAPGPSTCLMHPDWAGDLFHPRWYTCFDAVLLKHPTLTFSHRVQKSVLYIWDTVYFYLVLWDRFLSPFKDEQTNVHKNQVHQSHLAIPKTTFFPLYVYNGKCILCSFDQKS